MKLVSISELIEKQKVENLRNEYFELLNKKIGKKNPNYEKHQEKLLEKARLYTESKNTIAQKLFAEGKIAEAREFLFSEREFIYKNRKENGPLLGSIKNYLSKTIESFDKWGAPEENDNWKQKVQRNLELGWVRWVHI